MRATASFTPLLSLLKEMATHRRWKVTVVAFAATAWLSLLLCVLEGVEAGLKAVGDVGEPDGLVEVEADGLVEVEALVGVE